MHSPLVLQLPGFLIEFVTPIVKCSKNKKELSFFTLPEFEAWREQQPNNAKGWKTKYYKGLKHSSHDRPQLTLLQVSVPVLPRKPRNTSQTLILTKLLLSTTTIPRPTLSLPSLRYH